MKRAGVHTTLAAVALIAIALVMAGWAQAPAAPQDKAEAVSKVERKNRAPVSHEVLRVKLPKPQEVSLDNGLTVLILEDHRFPTVSVDLHLGGAGGLYDPKNMPGLAVVTASMLSEGTKTRNSRQIAEDVERLGATIEASSSFGSTAASITASGLSDNFDDWFAIAVDELLNANFPADELNIMKQQMKAGLRQQRSRPAFLARELFHRALYGEHPAAIVSATDASIDAMTPALLAQWRGERYVPQDAILGIAGDVSAARLIPKLKQWLAPWKKTELKETLPPQPTAVEGKKVYIVNRPNSVQTTILLGNIGLVRRDPDYVPLVVMNRIFGDGPAARLFLNLREEKGYTYGVYSQFEALKYPGPISAGGDMRTDVTGGAMTEFLNEINRIRDQKVPPAELDEAKRAVVARFALSLEQPSQLLTYEIVRRIYDLPADYWDTYPAKIMAVTADDVERVAQKYLQPANLQVVAVGDAAKIKPVLEKYGAVEVFDTEGHRVTAATGGM